MEGGRRPLTKAYTITTIAQHIQNKEAANFKTYFSMDAVSEQASLPRITFRGNLFLCIVKMYF